MDAKQRRRVTVSGRQPDQRREPVVGCPRRSGAIRIDDTGEARDRGIGKQHPEPEVTRPRLPDAGHQPRRHQRLAAE
jgi:hypothetical protein